MKMPESDFLFRCSERGQPDADCDPVAMISDRVAMSVHQDGGAGCYQRDSVRPMIAIPSARIVEVFCEVDDFCQAFLPQWEASLLGPGGPAPREPGLTPSEIITLLLTVQVSNISRASITASPSRWLLSWHALL
jgi:hypothetical protein